jgi:transposase
VEKTAKRRMRSRAERRQIVEETFKMGASVAQIARAHGVNANQVFNWRRLYHAGQLEGDSAATKLLPVKIEDVPAVVAATSAKRGEKAASGVIDIDLGHARVRIEGSASAACIRAVMEGLRR